MSVQKYKIDKYTKQIEDIKKIWEVLPDNFKRKDLYIRAMEYIRMIEEKKIDLLKPFEDLDNPLRNLCLLYHLDLLELKANYDITI